jgi:hypothetical protein
MNTCLSVKCGLLLAQAVDHKLNFILLLLVVKIVNMNDNSAASILIFFCFSVVEE